MNETGRAHARRSAEVLAFLALALLAPGLLGQTPEKKPDALIGEAVAADADARKLTLKPDAGGTVVVTVAPGASVLRAQPGAKSLSDASPLPLAEVAPGDRVLVRGAYSADRASFEARQVVVMAKDEIARKREAERADWRRRGVLGVVTAADPATGEITLRVGRGAVSRPLIVATAGRPVAFRRYAPDSVKFSDAKASAVGEVKAGDELRARGDRSADGQTLLAEEVVFGSFRLVYGTLAAVDPAKGEVVLRDDESKARLTVAVGQDARVRRLPPEIAARLLRRRDGEGAGNGAAVGTEGTPARADGGENPQPAARRRPDEGAAPGAAPGEGGGRRFGREAGAGPEDLLERLPAITLADLKSGDRVLVSSTKGADAARLNAIALVAGLEALAPPAPTGRAARGGLESGGMPGELMDFGMSLP